MKASLPALAVCLLLLAVLAVGCGPSDPRDRVLTERVRWNVDLLDWAEAADGTITLSARVSGPPRSQLDELTVRLLLQDAAGAEVGREWWTIDLSGIQRGGPEDMMLRLAPRQAAVHGIGIDSVPAPTADEQRQIPELNL